MFDPIRPPSRTRTRVLRLPKLFLYNDDYQGQKPAHRPSMTVSLQSTGSDIRLDQAGNQHLVLSHPHFVNRRDALEPIDPRVLKGKECPVLVSLDV